MSSFTLYQTLPRWRQTSDVGIMSYLRTAAIFIIMYPNYGINKSIEKIVIFLWANLALS